MSLIPSMFVKVPDQSQKDNIVHQLRMKNDQGYRNSNIHDGFAGLAKNLGNSNVFILSSPEELRQKTLLVVGEINAGNHNPSLINQAIL